MITDNAKEVRVPFVIRGTGVGRGVAIGPLRFGPVRSESRKLRVDGELMLLERAVEIVREELKRMEARAVKSVGEEHGEIYRLLLSELDGGGFIDAVRSLIENGEGFPEACESAVKEMSSRAEESDAREDRASLARAREMKELLTEASEGLSNDEEGTVRAEKDERRESDGKKYILVASDVDGILRGYDRAEDIAGIVSVGGSESFGLAAYAKARGLPALVISAADAPSARFEGSGAIIDTEKGRLTINPDLAALDKFTESARASEEKEERLASLIGLPSVTRSGRHVSMLATIGSGSEIAGAVSADAEGIGLLVADVGTEEEHYEIYKNAIEGFSGRPVTVGICSEGDGIWGIRFLLERREILKRELRALLRAASHGEMTLAVSGASSPEEIRRVRAVMVETALDLKNERIPFGERLRLGAMIDTPAAALCGELIAPEVEMFIADTDSLSSFSLAVRRSSPAFAEVMRRNPEPVLRLIEMATRSLHSSGKGKLMGVTGEMAFDRSLTERLVETGVDFLSVPPPYVLEMREKIRECPE